MAKLSLSSEMLQYRGQIICLLTYHSISIIQSAPKTHTNNYNIIINIY